MLLDAAQIQFAKPQRFITGLKADHGLLPVGQEPDDGQRQLVAVAGGDVVRDLVDEEHIELSLIEGAGERAVVADAEELLAAAFFTVPRREM